MKGLRRALLLVLVACVGWALCVWAERTHLALRPGAIGWAVLRGAAPKGIVSEHAGLLLPGVERDRTAELHLSVEPASGVPVVLELRVDGELEAQLPIEAPREIALTLKTAPVDALRLELVSVGGPLRVVALDLLPGSTYPRIIPVLGALLAVAVLLFAWRARQPTPLALALFAGSLVALAASLPFSLVAWPAAWRNVWPALSVLCLATILGSWRGRRAFARDAALVAAFVFGASVRLLFLPSTGSWDTEYWKAWMHRTQEAGLTQAYGPAEAMPAGHALAQYRGAEEAWKTEWRGRQFVVDYPPLSMALWAWCGRLVDALVPSLPSFERDNIAVKLPALLGDVLALLVLPWTWRPQWRRGLVLALVYWALPLSWLSSAVLGYFDGVLPPLLVLALFAAGTGQAVLAAALLALAALVKPTALIVLPAAAVALWRARASLVRAGVALGLVGMLGFVPYLFDGTLVTALVHCARLFLQENLSGGYPNGWWLLGHALTFRQAHGVLGPVVFAPIALVRPIPARFVGTLLFALCAAYLVRRQPTGARAAYLGGGLLFLAYGMLGVGVHENHPHPLFLLLLATGLATRRLRLLFGACAVVYIFDLLSLSGIGRFHGLRYVWLLPLSEWMAGLRMALGIDLTLPLTLLHIAAFAAALAWAKQTFSLDNSEYDRKHN